tara:strand:- start:4342 stop:5646 length:1305 start_codon:yes stop_codon:yes gene_type:complete
VIKILRLILLFPLILGCSLDKKTGIWSETEKKLIDSKLVVQELFKDEKKFNEEFNTNIRIRFNSKLLNNSFSNNLINNTEIVNFNGNLNTISKYKFSKIDNFYRFEPEMVFDKKNLIFFDNKGSILKFDTNTKLVWKKNIYNKSEKKLNPMISLAINENYLIVVDNLAKYYAMNVQTGDLLWIKNNIAPFNSQIKIYKNLIFVIDFQNVLRCYSIIDGKELWNIRTDNSFVKSQKKLSLIIYNGKVFFNNNLGDISSVDINKGKLIWQTPTQDSSIYESSFHLKTSDLILANNSIYFSNNNNEFYSLDIKTGTLIWKQKINSSIRPTSVENLVFTVSENGFLIVVEADTGNIVRITDVFDKINKKKRDKIRPVGFVLGKEKIYLTTNNGRLIVIDILTGKSNQIIKIDNEMISKPFILDKNLFIIKNNSITKLD